MYKHKKAQISDTISWIVATIIIVLILSIPILLVNTGIIGTNRVPFYRMEDPIATKSLSGYLLQNYGKIIKGELGNEEPSPMLESSLNSFLTTLARDKKEEWGADILVNTNLFYKKRPSGLTLKLILGKNERAGNAFYFEEIVGKVVINFWMESERGALDN